MSEALFQLMRALSGIPEAREIFKNLLKNEDRTVNHFPGEDRCIKPPSGKLFTKKAPSGKPVTKKAPRGKHESSDVMADEDDTQDDEEEEGPITVVFKVDMHCEGCARKVKRCVKRYEGVYEVIGDMSTSKLTVKGKVDPMKLRDRIELKTMKKVELISPLPKKKKNKDVALTDYVHAPVMEYYGHAYENEYNVQTPEMKYGNEMKFYAQVYGNGYYVHAPEMDYYRHGYGNVHAPQIFSDENPNACSIS